MGDHVKMRELRKDAEKEEEMFRKRKINEEADSILKKEMEELEARHRVRMVLCSKRACLKRDKISCWESKANILKTSGCQDLFLRKPFTGEGNKIFTAKD